ncbi:MAG TPA: molybdenum cofactor guanylyltransferase [bacterium]|nr:molybdenum cofactor guanylyltransferase [bacterium]
MALAGVILAGGQSRRMGCDKALLLIGGRPLVEVIAGRLRDAGLERLLLVTNTPERFAHLADVGFETVKDALPSGHPLTGAYSGVLHAGTPAFVCACDMPFLNPALIRYLASLVCGADAVVPRHARGYEPLHAVYTPACLDGMRRCVARGGPTTGFLDEVRARVVEADELRRFDPDLASFENINTPEEYAAALARLRPS